MTDASPVADRPAVIAKIGRRLIPFLGILYLIAYLDRQNVSFAKLQMVGDLHLSEGAYGLGASLFFIGYFLFEVPSNLILERVGARSWFTRIMITWGLVTIALAFTTNATMFYALRFALGACEAGFFPGVLFLLTRWFPFQYRARRVGGFMFFSAIANAVGAPIGGLLLDLNGLAGLRGWQWVFLCTGLPAVLAGIAVFFCLEDRPEKASFLTDDEKQWLAETLAREDQAGRKLSHGNPLKALLDPRILLLSLWYVCLPLGAYGISYWLPTLVKSFGVSNTTNGLINIIPWTVVALALWLVPKVANATGRTASFIAWPAIVGAVCLLASVYVAGPAAKLALISLAAAGIFSAQPSFWTLPTRFLTGASAAAGLAAINSVGNLGGFVAQSVVPLIKDYTHSVETPLLFVAACVLAGGVTLFPLEAWLSRRTAKANAETEPSAL